jgi:NCAIR mutase (PurE)-related protein
MDVREIRRVLNQLSKGTITVSGALERLRGLPFENLDFARLDHHRELRRGFPEVVFGLGKSLEQIVAITDGIVSRKQILLVTRTNREVYEAVRERHPRAKFNEPAGAVYLVPRGRRLARRRGIVVLSAGTSDIPVAEEAALTAELMGHRAERIYDVGVAGLHRLAAEKGKLLAARVLIVVAGMEGALPSVVAGLVDAPVIGVPTSIGYGASLGGLTALMGMLTSCSTGLTVVNIDNGFGAGYAASQINRTRSGRSG